MRKKRNEEIEEDGEGGADGAKDPGVMNFTLFTKRGNKQQASTIPFLRAVGMSSDYWHRQTRQIAIPAESALAVQTRTAQMQDKVEQQHLKRLVLNYEQREEAEELKGESYRGRSMVRDHR